MKQIFKGEVLTRTKVSNNIMRVYQSTTKEDRKDWYKEARTFATYLRDTYGYPLEVCVGVIAALSPLKKWEENKKEAEKFLKLGDCGHIFAFKDKARDIVQGADIPKTLRGRKITAFYHNIMGCKENVTIDRHALSVALGRKVTESDYQGMTKQQYEFFVECYTKVALKVNKSPSQIQAATWVAYRKTPLNG